MLLRVSLREQVWILRENHGSHGLNQFINGLGYNLQDTITLGLHVHMYFHNQLTFQREIDGPSHAMIKTTIINSSHMIAIVSAGLSYL